MAPHSSITACSSLPQVLSELPVVAPPLPPPQPVPAPAAASEGAGAAGAAGSMEGVADWVPACEVQLARPLQPAKLAAYRAVVNERKTALAVAEAKGIRESTVQVERAGLWGQGCFAGGASTRRHACSHQR